MWACRRKDTKEYVCSNPAYQKPNDDDLHEWFWWDGEYPVSGDIVTDEQIELIPPSPQEQITALMDVIDFMIQGMV